MNLSFHSAVLLALQSHNPTGKGSSFERQLLNALIVSRRWNGTVSSETPDECRILSAEAHLREKHSGGAGRLQPYRGAARREGRVQGDLLLRGRLREPSGDARLGRHHDGGSRRGGSEGHLRLPASAHRRRGHRIRGGSQRNASGEGAWTRGGGGCPDRRPGDAEEVRAPGGEGGGRDRRDGEEARLREGGKRIRHNPNRQDGCAGGRG